MKAFRKLSYGPLERAMTYPDHNDAANDLGVSARTIDRWVSEGIPWPAADRAAVAIGLHPAIVWGGEFYDDNAA